MSWFVDFVHATMRLRLGKMVESEKRERRESVKVAVADEMHCIGWEGRGMRLIILQLYGLQSANTLLFEFSEVELDKSMVLRIFIPSLKH